MTSINWNDGRLINMVPGDTATCTALNAGQLYCLFFYNSAQNAADITANVVWSGSQPPVSVTIPGTTQNQGLAGLCFVDGNQTTTVAASVPQGQSGAQLQAFIGSVKMPVNTSGINNRQLPLDGNQHAFQKFTRYYSVPASNWYNGMIQSNITQFISVQFANHRAVVNVANSVVDPNLNIAYAGDTQSLVTINQSASQQIPWQFQGNGQQMVWINADSPQNSQDAYISVQSMVSLYDSFANAPQCEEELAHA